MSFRSSRAPSSRVSASEDCIAPATSVATPTPATTQVAAVRRRTTARTAAAARPDGRPMPLIPMDPSIPAPAWLVS